MTFTPEQEARIRAIAKNENDGCGCTTIALFLIVVYLLQNTL